MKQKRLQTFSFLNPGTPEQSADESASNAEEPNTIQAPTKPGHQTHKGLKSRHCPTNTTKKVT
ncbi:predicted protein [Coccidioides posadasii str. Silveira]|uniref:Predicted protein n=1 Tax=Coccidioides posadasii (strain RMSCC 757 / Silveira) TaxID=443226 RepID=E9D502_COCPS|nr:predicted protein [Coccidioides posadasii str. Silveira]